MAGAAHSLGGALAIGLIVILAVGLYFLPTIIGATRKVVNIGSVFAINLLLGWSLIGWAVALAMALRTNPPYAYPQWQQANVPGQPVPAPAAQPGWYPDGSGGARWWDGRAWTGHYRAPGTPPPEQPSAPSPPIS